LCRKKKELVEEKVEVENNLEQIKEVIMMERQNAKMTGELIQATLLSTRRGIRGIWRLCLKLDLIQITHNILRF